MSFTHIHTVTTIARVCNGNIGFFFIDICFLILLHTQNTTEKIGPGRGGI